MATPAATELRAVTYARYSTSLQSATSTDDQHRLCREYAAKQGWKVMQTYSDAAISGATMLRPGLQAILAAAREGSIDVVIAEALDRMSRDQEDVAAIFKRLSFAGVALVTLSEGEITSLHVGLKGTMNALFLKDLADKTRRGMRGKLETGKAVAGIAFGYGVTTVGAREIIAHEAAIVTRIFADYAQGKSPRAIARALNAENMSGPGGRAWGPSTIIGNRQRGNGLLNNEIYIGRMIWNRQRFIKDPDSRKRQARMNPRDQWITIDVPDLRIVDDGLWEAVKARQGSYEHHPLAGRRRPKHLLSGKTKCGCCGGGMSIVGAGLLGCTSARDRGTCDNRKTIKRTTVERRILRALEHEILRDDLFADFCAEYTREMNRLVTERRNSERGIHAELAKVTRQLDNLVQALKDGVPASRVKEDMIALEARRAKLAARTEQAAQPPTYLHPNMAALYRRHVVALREGIEGRATGPAQEAIRDMVDHIVITPADPTPQIELVGDLAGILRAATGKKEVPAITDGHSASLVAGLGFEPRTFRL